MEYNYKIWSDGGCSVHTEHKMYGSYVIMTKSGKTKNKKFELGEGTNNQAEYLSVIEALNDLYKTITDAGKESSKYSVVVYVDSMLVKQQVTGKWKIKDQDLKSLHATINYIVTAFSKVDFVWIPREEIVDVLGH